MDTPPTPETILAGGGGGREDKPKRARKRSRYLDHHYQTPSILNALHGGGHHHRILTPPPPPPPRKGPAMLLHLQEANVATPDLLAALHRSAACPHDLPGPGTGALLGFFALHRDRDRDRDSCVAATHRRKPKDTTTTSTSTSTCVISSSSSSSKDKDKDDDDAAAPRLNPCRAMPLVHTQQAGKGNAKAVAMEHSSYAGVGPVNAAALGVGGGAGPSKRRNKNKKPTAKSSPKQGQHSGKPVALILQFAAQGTHQPLPTKEQLHATFRSFGPLIEPSTDITKKQARVVFQSRAAAEAAYSCVHTLGAFAAARLQYLRPPPPAPKIPLTDVRKNLERMIASLTGPSLLGKDSAWSLAREMQHLLFKVDRALGAAGAGPSTSAAARHR